MERDDRYLTLLRRELIRAQARLKRLERERDRLLEQNAELRRRLAAHGIEGWRARLVQKAVAGGRRSR